MNLDDTISAKDLLAAARSGQITVTHGGNRELPPLADFFTGGAVCSNSLTLVVGGAKLPEIDVWKLGEYHDGDFRVTSYDGENSGKPEVRLEGGILTIRGQDNEGVEGEEVDLSELSEEEQGEVFDAIEGKVLGAYRGWKVTNASQENIHNALTGYVADARAGDVELHHGTHLGRDCFAFAGDPDRYVYQCSHDLSDGVQAHLEKLGKWDEETEEELSDAKAKLDRSAAEQEDDGMSMSL